METTSPYMDTRALDATDRGREFSAIVIARVNGSAHAGALVTVLCSDLSVAAQSADMRVPEALVGQADPYMATRLPLRVGLVRAKEMMLTGRKISAQTAAAWGLINSVVPDSELDSAIHELIVAVRRTGPGGRSLYKRFANGVLPKLDLATARDSLVSDEAGQGARAFATRTVPPWIT